MPSMNCRPRIVGRRPVVNDTSDSQKGCVPWLLAVAVLSHDAGLALVARSARKGVGDSCDNLPGTLLLTLLGT